MLRLKQRFFGNKNDTEADYKKLVSRIPTRAPIFLPTERIPLEAKLTGVRRVKQIYDDGLDRIYRPRLRALREKYNGQRRCFIIGNGPSLNRTDLDALKDEVTFAVNGFFLKAQELDWCPTFYVVEDHLVAEDRSKWINPFKGPTKLFPAYLAYCLDESDDTIFFNHRPRKSYPRGFDFSREADKVTYTGCTVTFTCMQLAAYLGFSEIYLIGVDASYDIPKDAKQGDAYGVGVLDMKSDDPNHFHPDYFGKGFRWHDPQVNKMVEAYTEARRVLEATPQRIYNATVGGKLEVFERRSFASIFPDARSPEQMEKVNSDLGILRDNESGGSAASSGPPPSHRESKTVARRSSPRLLIIDNTLMGNGTATGELKQSLLSGWPDDRLMQIYGLDRGRVGYYQPAIGAQTSWRRSKVDRVVAQFNPEVILYRPTPDNRNLHTRAMKLIRASQGPLITWIMDDWPKRLASSDAPDDQALLSDLEYLLRRSDLRLSICDAMSRAFEERYGVEFTAVANGVEQRDWPLNSKGEQSNPIRVRYGGGLAKDMTLQSVARIARAIEALAANCDIVFEIKTLKSWQVLAQPYFEGLLHTKFITEVLSPEDYREWVRNADIAVIAYNFDDATKNYVQYSMANKMPECLASGAAVFAHGPRGLATIDYLAQKNCAEIVDTTDETILKKVIEDLATDSLKRAELASRARRVAFNDHDIGKIGAGLRSMVVEAAGSEFVGDQFPRSACIRINETKLISQLIGDGGGVMLDIGAHCGESARHFAKPDWRVFCFEPDETNRRVLESKFSGSNNVTIDARAVAERSETGRAFFGSEESSGISSLLPFTEGHEEIGSVDVTTVAEIVKEYGIERVEFLKIDVEGLDFEVLKGVSWKDLKPNVIECEFEDAKVEQLKYSWSEIADYLENEGYSVYVSEWHPIRRYGVSHDWHGLKCYPCRLSHSQAWGNIIAFKSDPGSARLASAVADQVQPQLEDQAADASRAGWLRTLLKDNDAFVRNDVPFGIRKAYAQFADWVRRTCPPLFVVARSTKGLLKSALIATRLLPVRANRSS